MINENINKNIKKIKSDYKNTSDLSFKDIKIKNLKLSLVFLEALVNTSLINDFILKSFDNLIKKEEDLSYHDLLNYFISYIPSCNIKEIDSLDSLYDYLGNGFCGILIDKESKILVVEAKENLSRGISTPQTEQTISGPKDSFTENYSNNIGLIRKRIKTKDLTLEELTIGKQTSTKVAIMYLNNIIEKPILNEIRKKINKITIDGILDSTYISEEIVSTNSIFPLIETTERPDVACMNLLEGKICIIVENSPNVLIIPTFFIDLFHAPEDYYQKSKNVTFTRIIRLISFVLAICLPAFYIAITTYNHETIPLTLIVNFASQRDGVPFPAIVEALGMSLIFEILRESDIRMPNFAGSAISILGAIVLGDAAVTAGIVSPIMVIVVSISSICSLMFSHIAMVNAIRIWKIVFMLFATFLGLPGLYFAMILLIIRLCTLKSFGKPYLYPISPINFKNLKDSFIKVNIKKRNIRNTLLTNKNLERK